MKITNNFTLGCVFMALASASTASAFVQYPYDIDNIPQCWTNWAALGATVCPSGQARGPEDVDWNNDGIYQAPPLLPNGKPSATHMHLAAGDGMAKMADGSDLYIFSFSNLTGIPDADTMSATFHAEISAPTIDVSEGQAFYLTLSNIGMVKRPDLFDPHTVHFHGYPNAASVFDGEPMASFGIRMMQDLTYFYQPYGPIYQTPSVCVDPGSAGTYMYHCHIEATEHMEMGMLGNSIIRPTQDGTAVSNAAEGRSYTKFAYNDCLSASDPLCGSTGYDVEKTIQFTAFDPVFHQADLDAQPPPFSTIVPVYFLLNGRSYPDTVSPAAITNSEGYASQKLDAKITAASGQTILLRLSNLSVKDFVTVEAPGLNFNVIGMCARQLRNPGPDLIYGTADDKDLSYSANSVMIGPGESFDVIVRTAGAPAGTYHLVSRNLDQLNNNGAERGGAMTEITIQ
jgi:FtsP/CotA-like multicopper oxidase with cupredoxin domain